MPAIGAYGEQWSDVYDELYQDRDDVADVVALVERFAKDRSVLEMGVGTGRLAFPLHQAGFRVHGVDASPEMLSALAAKPAASGISVTEADMTTVRLDQVFGVAMIAFSTLCLLEDAESQVRCLGTAAAHLTSDGVLIVETFVLDPARWNGDYSVAVPFRSGDEATLNVGILDRAAQTIESMRVDVRGRQGVVRRNRLRYVYPSELDLMARLQGMQLIARFADFGGTPFGPAATNAISVYRATDD